MNGDTTARNQPTIVYAVVTSNGPVNKNNLQSYKIQ